MEKYFFHIFNIANFDGSIFKFNVNPFSFVCVNSNERLFLSASDMRSSQTLMCVALIRQTDLVFLTALCQTYWRSPELFVKPKMSAPSTFFISCWLEPGSTSNVSRLSLNNNETTTFFFLFIVSTVCVCNYVMVSFLCNNSEGHNFNLSSDSKCSLCPQLTCFWKDSITTVSCPMVTSQSRASRTKTTSMRPWRPCTS